MRVEHASEAPGLPKHHPRWACIIELDHSDEGRPIVELCAEAGFDLLKCSLEGEHRQTYDGDVAVIHIVLPAIDCEHCRKSGLPLLSINDMRWYLNGVLHRCAICGIPEPLKGTPHADGCPHCFATNPGDGRPRDALRAPR
jgi:hypothetical protein